jgi:hypothetical protein
MRRVSGRSRAEGAGTRAGPSSTPMKSDDRI